MAANNAGKKKLATKSEIQQRIAEATGTNRKQVAAFFDALAALIQQEIGKKGPGEVKIAGLLKVKRVEKPATKAKMGRNPRTGEPMEIKAKPKRTIVRVRALKPLQEMVK
jgi:nucleoid DNA-binding protein